MLLNFRRHRKGGPRITYERAESPNPAASNARGTHLNESADSRTVEDYIGSFDLRQELQNPVVVDNLLFIDEVVSPLLPPDATVVDIGCGIGRYARFFARPDAPTGRWRYAGVDLTEEVVGQARKLSPDCEFKSSGGTTSIPFADASRDLVMASSMLQYTGEDWRNSLREMKRVACKYILISRLPLLRKFPSAWCHQTVTVNGDTEKHYFKIFNRHEFEDAVSAMGCRVAAKDYSSEILSVAGISEPVVLNVYLIAL